MTRWESERECHEHYMRAKRTSAEILEHLEGEDYGVAIDALNYAHSYLTSRGERYLRRQIVSDTFEIE